MNRTEGTLSGGGATALQERARFLMLGPLEVHVDDGSVTVRSGRERTLLATLLLRANRLVTLDELVESVWGERLPDNPRATVQTIVMRLRKRLPDGPRIIRTHPGGYLATPAYLDLEAFRAHVAAADDAARAGDRDREAVELRSGLALRRGPILANVPSEVLHRDVVPALEEELLAALERRIGLNLELDPAASVIAELRTLIAEHPLRERLWALLIRALHGSGRTAEALDTFEKIRGRLGHELGVEPGEELRRSHLTVVTGAEPAPNAVARQAVPRQLPPDVRAFTGRAAELAHLYEQLAEHDRGASTAVVVTAIAGTAGIGKTALSVHFGHRIAGQFPDGQLYVDLRGYTSTSPMTPVEALQRLLRALGQASDQIATDVAELATTYRSLLSGKRVLVVLDNARTAEQVEPLVPGYSGCFVLITSRNTLATVDGASHVHLDVLSEPESLRLLARLAGSDRIDAEPDAARTLVELCARLPLAVRIAGARLAARPNWSVGMLVDRLADERQRLDELQVGERAVRASFAVSYQVLRDSHDPVDRLAARAFRLLGVLDWAEMSVPIAAALLDRQQDQTRTALERLVDSHLLHTTGRGRYRAHDLLRLFAAERARSDEPVSEQDAARTRALDCYIAAAEWGTAMEFPSYSDQYAIKPAGDSRGGFAISTSEGLTEWVAAERANLVLANRQAVTIAPALAVRLSAALERPFNTRGYWQDVLTLREFAADIAHELNDRPGAARAWQDLGYAYIQARRVDDGIAAAQRAAALWHEIGHGAGEQFSLNILGLAFKQRNQYEEAIKHFQQGLKVSQDVGHRRGEGAILNNLGMVYQHLNEYDQAIRCHRAGLAIQRENHNRYGEAAALINLGWAHCRCGQAADAIRWFEQGLTITRDIGNRQDEAEALWGLGQAHHLAGAAEQARTYWHGSISILDELGRLTPEEAERLPNQPIPDTPAIIQQGT